MERARVFAEGVARADKAPLSLSDIQSRSRDVPDQLFDAFDVALGDTNEQQAAEQLARPIAALNELRSRLLATPRLRPFTAVWDATEGALAHLDDAGKSWVKALSAADMGDAQRLAAHAQRQLDGAAPPLASASSALQDLEHALGGSSAQMLGFLAERTATRRDSEGGEVYDAGRDPYAQFVRSAVTSRDEFSHLLAFEDERARLLFDRERFWTLVEQTYRQLDESDHFAQLVEDQEWRERFLAASDQLADAGLEAEAIAQAAFHDRQLVRADLGVIKTLLEGPAKALLRSRLALQRRRPFAQVRGDATSILHQAGQAGLSAATLGLRKDLRNAISHEDFSVEDGVLVLDRGQRSERRVERDELTDQVLAALESTLAMHTAVTLALWRTDEDLAAETGRRAVSPEQACYLCLQLAGYHVSDVTVEQQQIRVQVATGFDSKTLSAIAGLAWLLPEAGEWLVIVSQPDGVVEGPLATFREFGRATDEWKRELLLWRTLTTWRWNDRPVAGPAILRCWVASLAVHTREESPAAAIRRFRDLRTLAEDCDDGQLVSLINDVLSFHQHRLTDLPMGEKRIRRMMSRIEDWGRRPSEWPRLIPDR